MTYRFQKTSVQVKESSEQQMLHDSLYRGGEEWSMHSLPTTRAAVLLWGHAHIEEKGSIVDLSGKMCKSSSKNHTARFKVSIFTFKNHFDLIGDGIDLVGGGAVVEASLSHREFGDR